MRMFVFFLHIKIRALFSRLPEKSNNDYPSQLAFPQTDRKVVPQDFERRIRGRIDFLVDVQINTYSIGGFRDCCGVVVCMR